MMETETTTKDGPTKMNLQTKTQANQLKTEEELVQQEEELEVKPNNQSLHTDKPSLTQDPKPVTKQVALKVKAMVDSNNNRRAMQLLNHRCLTLKAS